MQNVKGVSEDELTSNEFERLLTKKYLSEKYHDERVKEFYEFQVSSMIDY